MGKTVANNICNDPPSPCKKNSGVQRSLTSEFQALLEEEERHKQRLLEIKCMHQRQMAEALRKEEVSRQNQAMEKADRDLAAAKQREKAILDELADACRRQQELEKERLHELEEAKRRQDMINRERAREAQKRKELEDEKRKQAQLEVDKKRALEERRNCGGGGQFESSIEQTPQPCGDDHLPLPAKPEFRTDSDTYKTRNTKGCAGSPRKEESYNPSPKHECEPFPQIPEECEEKKPKRRKPECEDNVVAEPPKRRSKPEYEEPVRQAKPPKRRSKPESENKKPRGPQGITEELCEQEENPRKAKYTPPPKRPSMERDSDEETNDNYEWRETTEIDVQRKAPGTKDYVDYFFEKGGFPYIGILTQMKVDYTGYCKDVMQQVPYATAHAAKQFKIKVDIMRKVNNVIEK